MPSVPAILAWLVIIAVPFHWIVFAMLWGLVRTRPKNLVLRDRFYTAGFLAALVTVFGGVFLNNDIIPPPFTLQQTQVVTRTMVLLAIIPSAYWLWLYRRPRVDDARERTQNSADAERETKRDVADAERETKRDAADAAREESHHDNP